LTDETTLEEEIIADPIQIEEIKEMEIDSIEDLDLVLHKTIEVHQEIATTMISEDNQEERDQDLVAEMHLHTVENGIEMRTDILSEDPFLTTEAEAQTENRAAEDLTTIEVALFQIRSHTARDLLTEEKEAEAVADMTTTTDDQWTMVSQETDSKEEAKADQMASSTAATVRESTTVTASIAIKRDTSLSTAALLQDQEVANMVDTVAAAAAAAEATITIGKIDKTTTLTVSDSVEKQLKTSLLISIPHLRYKNRNKIKFCTLQKNSISFFNFEYFFFS